DNHVSSSDSLRGRSRRRLRQRRQQGRPHQTRQLPEPPTSQRLCSSGSCSQLLQRSRLPRTVQRQVWQRWLLLQRPQLFRHVLKRKRLHPAACAPGSKNSANDKYNFGSSYNYRDFCDVNLVDDGYALKHG
ncbi:hypothetical protein CAPTEDRAFT_229290, partial [Capitella teleta]